MALSDQSKWKYVVTDMNGSTAANGAGQILNTASKAFSEHLNVASTAQVTIDVDNPVADFVMNHDAMMKVYRRDRTGALSLKMVGDVIHVEEDGAGDTQTVTILASDPIWRLHRRFVGLATNAQGLGIGWKVGSGIISQQFDMSFLTAALFNLVNGDWPHGMAQGSVSGTGTLSYIGPVYTTNAGDLLSQFCNSLGGPDVWLTPLEPSGLMPNAVIANYNVSAKRGVTRLNTAFEYGTGQRNVQSYSRVWTKDGICNSAYSTPQGFPDAPVAGDHTVTSSDGASITARGFFQDVVQSDVAAINLRQALTDEYVTVRTAGQQQITFVPAVDNTLDWGVDWGVGDIVQARAWANATKSYRYNGSVRIYGVDFTIDENDAETSSLTLIPGTA